MTHPTPKPMTVQLITAPVLPLESLWYIWKQSRHNNPIPSPQSIALLLNCQRKGTWNHKAWDAAKALGYKGGSPTQTPDTWAAFKNEFKDLFEKDILAIFDEGIPIAENLQFVFAIENMPISLREQMVRHRVGHHFGDRLGADIVPDLTESTWWSQTMRVLNMGTFYDDGQWILPDSIADPKAICPDSSPFGAVPAKRIYTEALEAIQWAYNRLIQAGIPPEDARQLIPLGSTHRITWGCNLKNLMHVIGKRSCWISQAGLWHDLISGMVEALSQEVSPMFRRIVNPPCIKGHNEWLGCPIQMVNLERVSGEDGFPPCPLWLSHYPNEASAQQDAYGQTTWTLVENQPNAHGRRVEPLEGQPFPGGWVSLSSLQADQMEEGRFRFAKLWGRDVDSGEPVAERQPAREFPTLVGASVSGPE